MESQEIQNSGLIFYVFIFHSLNSFFSFPFLSSFLFEFS